MPDLQTDNLYPNDSTYLGGVPKEPAEQDVERKKEKSRTLEALPILKEIIERLQLRIDFYGSVDAMPDELKTQPTKFMNRHTANELTRNNLRDEKEYLEGLLEIHAKGR